MRIKKRANAPQAEKGEEGDVHHAENAILGEEEGSRGTRKLSRAVGCM